MTKPIRWIILAVSFVLLLAGIATIALVHFGG